MNCYKCATPIPDESRFCLSCGADVSGGSSAERTQGVQIDHDLQEKLREELGAAFLLERELGRGGMAAVYLATEVDLGRKVAIKVLPPELTFGGGMVERFKREARTAATLDHPNIIPIYRVASGGKLFWYAMKYLEGEVLSDIIQREHQLDLKRSAAIISQVADALDYAHERGVIHRDIKPANVMLDARGRVTVTDFGIAKAVQNASMTGSGSMIGTPYYMSPEQCSGKKVTGQSDQYSLGVMAYQMLCGHLPFTGDSVFDIVKQHCMDPPPPLGALRPDLPPALIAVVERALAKNPADRFATENDFAKAFAGAASGQPVAMPVKVGATRRKSVTADVTPAPAELRAGRTPFGGLRSVQQAHSKRRAWVVPAAIGAVVVLGGIGVLLGMGMLSGSRAADPVLSPAPPEAGQPAESTGVATSSPPSAASQGSPSPEPPRGTAPPASPDAGASAAPAGRTVRFALTGVPAGATISRDGRPVSGRSWPLASGTTYDFRVTARGYEPWTQTVTVGPNGPRSIAVAMSSSVAAAPGAQQGAPPAGGPFAVQPMAANPPPPSAGAQFGTLRVSSVPQVPYTILGRRYVNNPGRVDSLPPGRIVVRFEATDSTVAYEAPVVIVAGETAVLRRIEIPRKVQ